jgi:hypothetical protein
MVMISTLYSTAENRVGSLAQRIHFQHLEGAHGPIGAMAGIAIITALLVAFGNALGHADFEHGQRGTGRCVSRRLW